MVVRVSRSRRMVPGPVSNSSRELAVCIRTEHELRFNEGTQVPEPSIVTFKPEFSAVISNFLLVLKPIRYSLFDPFF